MPLPDKTPPRELIRRPLDQPRPGPAFEHDNLWASRNDVGSVSCPAMFASMVRTLRADPDVEPFFLSGASDHLMNNGA